MARPRNTPHNQGVRLAAKFWPNNLKLCQYFQCNSALTHRRQHVRIGFGGGGDASLGFVPTRKDASEKTGECARGRPLDPGAPQEGARFNRAE